MHHPSMIADLIQGDTGNPNQAMVGTAGRQHRIRPANALASDCRLKPWMPS